MFVIIVLTISVYCSQNNSKRGLEPISYTPKCKHGQEFSELSQKCCKYGFSKCDKGDIQYTNGVSSCDPSCGDEDKF